MKIGLGKIRERLRAGHHQYAGTRNLLVGHGCFLRQRVGQVPHYQQHVSFARVGSDDEV